MRLVGRPGLELLFMIVDTQGLSEEEVARRIENMLRAKAVIQKCANGQRRVSGEIACPICKEPMKYSIAANGHIWAGCKTKNCVRFME